jgi:glutamate-1-semialdehyde 2,1-aminomutase
MRNDKSAKLFERARIAAPGGVHSDFRSAYPIFFESANGSRIVDVDGNRFIDYHMAFGPLILGHRNEKVLAAVRDQLDHGDIWGMGSHQLELDVAEKIIQHVPSAEKVRFCNSGSEATYHALRLARAYTRKKKVIKFEGSYNGWHDYLDIGVFPSKENLGSREPNSAGILEEATEQTIVLPYNDIQAFDRAVQESKESVAAVVVEPILHSCGCILPKGSYLKSLREITESKNIVLIFDEVITGFRHSLGGAQEILGVVPDLTVFAKAMANGFPAAAVCGSDDLMNQLQPIGKVHMAGTYSGHPISLAAAKATIDELEGGDIHEYLDRSGDFLRKEITKIIEEEGLPARIAGFRSIFTVYFMNKLPQDYRDLKMNNNDELFDVYCSKMHEQGIFIPPQAYKRCHISAAHSLDDLRETVEAAKLALHESKLFAKYH